MGRETRFDLDGKPRAAESPLSVRELLGLAGAPADAFCIEVSDGAIYCDPDQLVDVRDGDKLVLKRRPPAGGSEFHYQVNGEPQTATTNPVSAETVLRQAGAAAGIDTADLGSYYLENIADGSKYQNLDDPITLGGGEQFLAVHVGATPVA